MSMGERGNDGKKETEKEAGRRGPEGSTDGGEEEQERDRASRKGEAGVVRGHGEMSTS